MLFHSSCCYVTTRCSVLQRKHERSCSFTIVHWCFFLFPLYHLCGRVLHRYSTKSALAASSSSSSAAAGTSLAPSRPTLKCSLGEQRLCYLEWKSQIEQSISASRLDFLYFDFRGGQLLYYDLSTCPNCNRSGGVVGRFGRKQDVERRDATRVSWAPSLRATNTFSVLSSGRNSCLLFRGLVTLGQSCSQWKTL